MSGRGVLNLNWAWTLMQAFAAQGGTHVVVSPGSRSTPLALAAYRHPRLVTHVVVDERSAAFFALGLARRTEAPVALICTSGTAAANYHPALAEADTWGVSLIAFTADRPPRLRGLGAAQTINQVHLFGPAVEALELPVPESAALKQTALRVALALRAACTAPCRPLHLNVPFEEPLAPGADELVQWQPPEAFAVRLADTILRAEAEAVTQVGWHLHQAARPLVVAGPGAGDQRAAGAIVRWAAQSGVPVLADVGSGLRGLATDALLLHHADLYLRPPLSDALRPDWVLTVGRAMTSKAIASWLAAQTCPVVAVWPDWRGRDPDAIVTTVLAGDVAGTFEQLLAVPPPAIEPEWLDAWRVLEGRVRAEVQRVEPGMPPEAAAVRAAVTALPPEAGLVFSNSLPVRHADSYAGALPADVACVTIRGANGIDGLTSVAFGAARGALRPTLLVTGDLAFLHDVGALTLAQACTVPVVILVLDNCGGGIFHHLPVASAVPEFEALFGTPHRQDLSRIAQGFGLRVTRVDSAPAVGFVVGEALAEPGVTVVIFASSREQTVAAHRAFVAAVASEGGFDAGT